MQVPTLTTERLILRGPAPQDQDAFMAFFGSERAQYVGGPLPKKDAWRLFGLEIGHWVLRGFGMWTVTSKDSDAALGMVGMWRPEGWPEQELGWVLYPKAEGKGIAFEAAIAARDYAYSILRWETAVSYIDAPNARSRNLATRLGCWHDTDAATLPDTDDIKTLTYRHPSPQDLAS